MIEVSDIGLMNVVNEDMLIFPTTYTLGESPPPRF